MNLNEIDDAEVKKNLELAAKMREYQDPLLVDFDKEMSKKSSPAGANKSTLNSSSDEEDSGSDDQSDSDDSEEQEIDIQFPRNNVQDLLQFIHRDLMNINNMEDAQKRKFGLIKLYQIFVLAKNKAPNSVYQELLSEI